MKQIAILAALAIGMTASGAIACPEDGAAHAKHVVAGGGKTAKKDACQLSTKLEVMGMECAGCASKISKGLKAVKGVEGVHVDYEKGVAMVDYCSKEIKDTSLLLKAVEKAGFEAKLAADHHAAPSVPAKQVH